MLLVAVKSKKRRVSVHISLPEETYNRVLTRAIEEDRTFSNMAAQILSEAVGV